MITPHEGQTCSEVSAVREEPLYPTATHGEAWLLLEYPSPHKAHALAESDLPDQVKTHLENALARIPNSRVQLVKNQASGGEGGLRFVLVGSSEDDAWHTTLTLQRYEDLVDQDLYDLWQSGSRGQVATAASTFFLVCTNGARDPCCARYGVPVYRELKRVAGEPVWQTSHVGGHRFAANVLLFPHGLYYGRLRPSDVRSLVDATRRGELLLDNFRGRACYTEVAQAGEVLLRQETGELALSVFQLLEVRPGEGGAPAIVRFLNREDGLIHRLEIEKQVSPELAPRSCRGGKSAPVVSYLLRSHSAIQP
jgi:hypothetical protein